MCVFWRANWAELRDFVFLRVHLFMGVFEVSRDTLNTAAEVRFYYRESLWMI